MSRVRSPHCSSVGRSGAIMKVHLVASVALLLLMPGSLLAQQAANYDFQNAANGYFEQVQKFQEQLASNKNVAYAFTMSKPNGNARAESSLVHRGDANGGGGLPNSLQNIQRQSMVAIPDFSQFAAQFRPQPGQGGSAFASASAGPDGTYRTVGVQPENPNNPNVVNQYSPPAGGNSGQPGNFYGVFSSSFSSSSDVNGQRTETREAQTTTNDNGKITTHRVTYP